MAGTLFVVATPIGNLEDITLRALRVLREVDVVAAEDTRRTARLLTHYGIQTPTVSFHQHNLRTRLPQLLSRLESGQSVAIVTDAGTPSISDPGLELVQACAERDIAIDPIPGPSAHLAAAVAAGFPLAPFTILGFVPSRSKDRSNWLVSLAAIPHTVSFFEAPHRIEATLREAAKILGNRPLSVGRELTKAHQEFLRGTAAGIADRLVAPKGEFTVIVGPRPQTQNTVEPSSDAAIIADFGRVIDSGRFDRRAAIREVAARHARSPREVYAVIEKGKLSVK